MNELQELNKLRGQVTAMCMRILGRTGNHAMMHSTEELLRLTEAENVRLKDELAEALKVLERTARVDLCERCGKQQREHVHRTYCYHGDPDAERFLVNTLLLDGLASMARAFLQKHEKGAGA